MKKTMTGGKRKTKRRKTKKKKTWQKTGGARFPGLGKKIKEIMDKQNELNGRLHNIEQFYLPEITNNLTKIDLNNDHIIDLAKREGYLRSYINFQHRGNIQGEPYDGHETPMEKWVKHIDSHEGEDRADVYDYMQGGRKRKTRRKKRKRRKKRTRKR
jgi:hypothetical protein